MYFEECAPQPVIQVWNANWAYAVKGQRLTTWAMASPIVFMPHHACAYRKRNKYQSNAWFEVLLHFDINGGWVDSSVCTPTILTLQMEQCIIPLAALNTMARKKKILHLPESETTNSTMPLVTLSSYLQFHSQWLLS